jgi:hypothetical protein
MSNLTNHDLCKVLPAGSSWVQGTPYVQPDAALKLIETTIISHVRHASQRDTFEQSSTEANVHCKAYQFEPDWEHTDAPS